MVTPDVNWYISWLLGMVIIVLKVWACQHPHGSISYLSLMSVHIAALQAYACRVSTAWKMTAHYWRGRAQVTLIFCLLSYLPKKSVKAQANQNSPYDTCYCICNWQTKPARWIMSKRMKSPSFFLAAGKRKQRRQSMLTTASRWTPPKEKRYLPWFTALIILVITSIFFFMAGKFGVERKSIPGNSVSQNKLPHSPLWNVVMPQTRFLTFKVAYMWSSGSVWHLASHCIWPVRDVRFCLRFEWCSHLARLADWYSKSKLLEFSGE